MRNFDLGTVLSVTTGIFLAPDIGNVYDLLNYMTGDNLFTHQLPRAADRCRVVIIAQHPELANVDVLTVRNNDWHAFLAEQVAIYGNEIRVGPIPPDDYTHVDPIQELYDMHKRRREAE